MTHSVDMHQQVRIEHMPGLDRILVANRDFALGQVVIEEEPLVVYSLDSMPFSLLAKFAMLPADSPTRARILDMYVPSTKDDDEDEEQDDDVKSMTHRIVYDMSQKAGMLSRVPLVKACKLTYDTTLQVLLVHQFNAHSFLNSSQAALFFEGSKCEHSCVPNVRYSSSQGKLTYTCIRADGLRKHDHICFSYLDNNRLGEMCREERWVQLLREKGFRCMCARCDMLDFLRPLFCEMCDDVTTGVMLPSRPSKAQQIQWECTSCNHVALEPPSLAHEQRWRLEMNRLQATSSDFTFEEMDHQLSLDGLPKFHHLSMKKHRMLASIADTTTREGLEQAGMQLMHLIRAQEVQYALACKIAIPQQVWDDAEEQQVWPPYPLDVTSVLNCGLHLLQADSAKYRKQVHQCWDKYREFLKVWLNPADPGWHIVQSEIGSFA